MIKNNLCTQAFPVETGTPTITESGTFAIYQKSDGDIYHVDENNSESFLASPQFNFFSDTAISINSTTTFQDKINQTTTNLPAGTYELIISYNWNYNLNTNDFESQFLLDGGSISNTFVLHKQEPKDNAGNTGGTGSNQAYGFTKAHYVVLTAGTHTLQLQWRSANAGTNASIWDAYVSLKRVA